MNTLENADTFFYITSIAVIVVTILAILLLSYAVRIAQTIYAITKNIKRESENMIDDLAEMRERVKEEGLKVGAFWKFVTGFFLNRFADKMSGGVSSGDSGAAHKRKAKKED